MALKNYAKKLEVSLSASINFGRNNIKTPLKKNTLEINELKQ